MVRNPVFKRDNQSRYMTQKLRRILREQFALKCRERVYREGPGWRARTGSGLIPTHAEARASLIRGHLFDVSRAQQIADNLADYLERGIRDELVAMALRRIAGRATRALFIAATALGCARAVDAESVIDFPQPLDASTADVLDARSDAAHEASSSPFSEAGACAFPFGQLSCFGRAADGGTSHPDCDGAPCEPSPGCPRGEMCSVLEDPAGANPTVWCCK